MENRLGSTETSSRRPVSKQLPCSRPELGEGLQRRGLAKSCRRPEAGAGRENGRSRGEGRLQGERQVSSRGGCNAIEEEVWGQGC